MPHSGLHFLRFWCDLVPKRWILGAPWRPVGPQMAPKIGQMAPKIAQVAQKSSARTEAAGTFSRLFFSLIFLVRLGAKKVDFGSPLAPSWSQNGAQNHPSGAKKSPKCFQKGPRKYNPSHCFAPLDTNNDQ